jgi:hypothetical protein
MKGATHLAGEWPSYAIQFDWRVRCSLGLPDFTAILLVLLLLTTGTANYGYCKLPILQTADDEPGYPTVGRRQVLSDLTLIPDLFTPQKRLQIDRVTRRGQQAVTNWNIHRHGYTCAFAWALVAAWGTLRVYPWI